MLRGYLVHAMALGVFSLGIGCGLDEKAGQNTTQDPNAKASPEASPKAIAPSPVSLRGYISSAFDVTVDGSTYTDSEDFYTKQLSKLDDAKAAAGYEDYTLKFDAEIGLNDLKNGMRVYIAGIGDTGYAAEASVLADGTFAVQFPAEAVGDTFNIRAAKRIGVSLTHPGKDTVAWCYNFSADKQLTVADKDKPAILRAFSSRITKYKCAPQASAISIPTKPAPSPRPTPSPSSSPAGSMGVPVMEAFPSPAPGKTDAQVVQDFNQPINTQKK